MATIEGSYNGLAFGAGTSYHVSGLEPGPWDTDGVEDRDLPKIGNGSFVGRDRQGPRRLILTLTLIADTHTAYDTLVSDLIDATEPGAGDNLLTANQASIETDATGWVNNGNATVTRSTAQAAHGSASLSMASIAAGDMSAIRVGGGTGGVPVVAGRTYTALASFRAATAARTVRMDIAWFNAAGTLLSQSVGTGVADTTTGFVQASLTIAAPDGAAFAQPIVVVLGTAAAGEVHYVDKAAIHQGKGTVWTEGGKHMRLEHPLRLMGNTVHINARSRRRIIPIATDQYQRTGVATIEFVSSSPNVYSGAP